MSASFRAYIDESGDEGFKFRSSPEPQASSETLMPILYRHAGHLMGYGMKTVPRDALPKLRAESSLEWLRTHQ